MNPISRTAWGLCLLATGISALAQTPAAPAAPAAKSADATAARSGEPRLQRVVVEDDGVRIEELRLRGQLQRITVQSKIGGVRPYEIIIAPAGRDPSQERGNAGQRVWSLLSF